MKLRSLLAAAVIATGGIYAAQAADEPQVVRQEMMKKVGGAVGASAKMVKGEMPYDAAAAKAAMETIAMVMSTYPDLFPAGSEEGFETEAKAEIWQNMDDFKAKSAKLEMEAAAIAASAPADVDAFRAAFGPLTQNCGACHELYRVKKE